MSLRALPNIISGLRMLLVIPIVWSLQEEQYATALLLFFVAGMSDALDGFLAKRFGWTSRLGSILDPLADKALLVSCYLVLGWQGWLPLWLVIAVLVRDLVIVLGALAYHYVVGAVEMAPSLASKANTVLQIVLVLMVIASLGVMSIPAQWVNAIIYLTAAATVLSGIDYVWTWSRLALRGRDRGQFK